MYGNTLADISTKRQGSMIVSDYTGLREKIFLPSTDDIYSFPKLHYDRFCDFDRWA